MKVGLISDVHANVVALRAVLADAPAIDNWFHAGDVVGYGPWPRETIALFREHKIESIQGNHDRAVLEDFHDGFVGLPRKMAEWTTDQLQDDELAYLDSLSVECDYADGRIHIAHGAPGAPNTYQYSEDIDASLLGTEQVLVLGHTHVPVLQEFENRTVVNPGSVGQPRDGDWRSAYAIVDLETNEIELRRVAYSFEETKAKARAYDFPDPLISVYEEGRISPAELASWSNEES